MNNQELIAALKLKVREEKALSSEVAKLRSDMKTKRLEEKSSRKTVKTDLVPENIGKKRTIELEFVITKDLQRKMQIAKSKLSHINPSMSDAELFEILVKDALKKENQ